MKQYITKKQWEELSDGQMLNFWIPFLDKDEQIDITDVGELAKPNIGQLIEFLGDDWWKELCLIVEVPQKIRYKIQSPANSELCNALWEPVKEKLK